MWKRVSLLDLDRHFPPRGAAEVFGNQVSGYAANEPGETLRFSNLSPPDLFKHDSEGLLIKVISDSSGANFPANDAHNATIVTLDQLGLGLFIVGLQPAEHLCSVVGIFHR